jgi:uncharacterized protein
VGDYLVGNVNSSVLQAIMSRDEEVRSRRQAPDPESTRVWDTSCCVLGRGLVIGRSGIPNAGFGLFATQNFGAGELVTEYTGPEVNRNEALALRAEGKDQYVRSLKNGFCIDGNPFPALGEGCAQMANDGYPDGVPNNCEFVLDYSRDKVQEKPRVYLRTLRPILCGEELLASYGKTYWDIHLASSDDDGDADKKGDGDDVFRGQAADSDFMAHGATKMTGRGASSQTVIDIDVTAREVGGARTSHKRKIEPPRAFEGPIDSEYICLSCGDPEYLRALLLFCSRCHNAFHKVCVGRKAQKKHWNCANCSMGDE